MTSIFLSSMNEVRGYSKAAHHQELGFLVTGGSWPDGKSTTEVTKDGVTFEVFTPLPIALVLHCLVALDGDGGDFFVGGGYDGSNNNKRAFIHSGNQWVEMREMPTARRCKKPQFRKSERDKWLTSTRGIEVAQKCSVSSGAKAE